MSTCLGFHCPQETANSTIGDHTISPIVVLVQFKQGRSFLS